VVAAGETVTLTVGGFLPGERVLIALHDSDDVLGSAVAGPDGTVTTDVRIPDGLPEGATTVDLIGDESALLADVDLLVAGAESPVADDTGFGDLVPLTSAAVALVVAVAGLVSVAGRHRAMGSRDLPMHTA
jgi:hypothetical protein